MLLRLQYITERKAAKISMFCLEKLNATSCGWDASSSAGSFGHVGGLGRRWQGDTWHRAASPVCKGTVCFLLGRGRVEIPVLVKAGEGGRNQAVWAALGFSPL